MAKSFIHSLGGCIYREFGTVLSHDDMEVSFKEAIQKLPKGLLRKKIRKNFDKYLNQLEKHIAQLSCPGVPSISSRSQDDSLHELSVAEQRDGVAEKTQLEHKVAFNLLKVNPDCPDKKALRDCNDEQKRQIYSLFVRQALTRRDVSFEKLSQVIDRLEQVLPKSEKDEKNSGFAWTGVMDHLIQLSSGLHPSAVVRSLRLLFQKVENDVDNCLLKEKPVRSGKLAKILKSYLQAFHMRAQKADKGFDDRPYCRYLSALLSYYVDLACIHSCKVEKKKLHGRQICGFVSYLLQPWPEIVLEVMLQSSMINEDYADIMVPLIWKCVSLKPESKNHEHYLEYVLVVRLARDRFGNMAQVLEWTMIARQVPAGAGFLDWIQDKCPESSEHLPTEDKKFLKSNITKFLLEEAESDLIFTLIDSLRSPVTMVTEESFLSSYNQTDSGGPEQTTEDTEKGAHESGQDTENIFFLDTTGSQPTNRGKGKRKKGSVVLSTMAEMESLLDTGDKEDDTEPQTYKVDNALLDKFVDPMDKEFVQSEIVSITTVTHNVEDKLSAESNSANSSKAKQNTSSPKKSSSEILAQSKSGKGRIKELHTSGNIMSKPTSVFVSESESDLSLTEKDKVATIKSVVRKMTPKKKPPPDGEVVVNAKSETDASEATTVFSLGSDVESLECDPANSTISITGSDTNLSSDIGQKPYSLLSEMSDDRTLPSAAEVDELVVLDSDTDAEREEISRSESNLSRSTNIDTTISTADENILELQYVPAQDTESGTSVSVLDLTSDKENEEVTIIENNDELSKTPAENTNIDSSSSSEKSGRRKSIKSPQLKKSENEKKQHVFSGKFTSPKERGGSARKSRTSNSSKESDSGKNIVDDLKEDEESGKNFSESSVFIEIKDDEETDDADEKSQRKHANTSAEKPKSMMEKFIQKAEKRKPKKKTDPKDIDHSNSEIKQNKKESDIEDSNNASRTKSTEEIVILAEEIQQKLTTSSKKSSCKNPAAENSMFTDESIDSNTSETCEVLASKERKKSPKMSPKSALSKAMNGKPGSRSNKDNQRKHSDSNVMPEENLKSKSKEKTPGKKMYQTKLDIEAGKSDGRNGEITLKVNNPISSPQEKVAYKDSPKNSKFPLENDAPGEGVLVSDSDEDILIVEEHPQKLPSVTTPKSDKKEKSRKRSSERLSSPTQNESPVPNNKKQRLSSSEEAMDGVSACGSGSSGTQRRRSVAKLKVTASAEKMKTLKSYSTSQATPDSKLSTRSKNTPKKKSESEDLVLPSSTTKASPNKKLNSKFVSEDEDVVFDTDNEMAKGSETGFKNRAVLISDSDNELEIPDIGKHLKTYVDDDQMKPASPQIPKKHESAVKMGEKMDKLDDSNEKSRSQEHDEEEKENLEKMEPRTRRSVRPKHAQEISEDSAAEKKPSTDTKKLRTPGKRTSIAHNKDIDIQSETDQSETDKRMTRKSMGGRKITTKEPEKQAEGSSTPPSKPILRKLSASTSKKGVKKVEEMKAGRKRRLSGELLEADRGSLAGESTDSEITFPKLKKEVGVGSKQPGRASKRLSTSAAATVSAPVSPRSKRYPSRRK